MAFLSAPKLSPDGIAEPLSSAAPILQRYNGLSSVSVISTQSAPSVFGGSGGPPPDPPTVGYAT